ncbi:hypothetical protein ABZ40_15095 [Listeria monocytogenes]|nr:hypothetical protein [Listeria monocytogenes]
MRRAYRETEWESRKVDLLQELCLNYPYLNMNELAYHSHLTVEEVYSLIKEFNLPYCWKFQKNISIMKHNNI